MSNSNAHNHFPLPNLVVGGATGAHKGGRHLKYPDHTPMTNLIISALDKVGVPMDTLGDSTVALVGAEEKTHAHALSPAGHSHRLARRVQLCHTQHAFT